MEETSTSDASAYAYASTSLAATHVQIARKLVEQAQESLAKHETVDAMRGYHLSHLHTRGFAHPDAVRPLARFVC